MLKTPVIWFTGLPCSGKTTLAIELKKYFDNANRAAQLLDGDEIREKVSNFSFSTEARNLHISYIGLMASILEKQNIISIVSLVSPIHSSRDICRGFCENFIEIYLNPSLEECEKRDVKGQYKKARAGILSNFTGISGNYEVPLKPEIKIDTASEDVPNSLRTIIFYLKENKFVL
jgi:adenylylsulfate kinase